MAFIGLCIHYVLALAIFTKEITPTVCILYPRESETREVRSLDGLWNFVKSKLPDLNQGERDKWFQNDLSRVQQTIPMSVPASYNDMTTECELRDHVGPVWYDRKFYTPKSWANQHRVFIHFGSVHYKAIVYINGNEAVRHQLGHLPFQADITKFLKYGMENRVTVMCDNTLLETTVPQGKITEDGSEQTYTFDFFNYAGIHRPVHLYTTPLIYIDDIEVTTNLTKENSVGHINYKISTKGTVDTEAAARLYVRVYLHNKEDIAVAEAFSLETLEGVLEVPNVIPWWPYLMHSEPGYLYQMVVFLYDIDAVLYDVYRLPVGIRTLSWQDNTFLINSRPVYFRGIGRHEDSDIRGRGLDLALMARDFNLLKWSGANAYRTSHYPYSEESMQFADENGIMIIDECAGVYTEDFTPDDWLITSELMIIHRSSIKELILRDRNHPSVVMWSIANEPNAQDEEASLYYKKIADYARELDATRPVTAAIDSQDDTSVKHLDIISFNRYNGWYDDSGLLYLITNRVVDEAKRWYNNYKKPVIMSSYGADTLEGLHLFPSFVWSEEYQSELFSRHFEAFDNLRNNSWFIGEFAWTFADFQTAQSYKRVGGDKKGLFTRNRQPKAAAHLLRKRYFELGRELDRCELPKDVFSYITHKQKH